MSFFGNDVFGNPVGAVRCTDGSFIMQHTHEPSEDEDEEDEIPAYMSLDAKSAARFADWLKEQPDGT